MVDAHRDHDPLGEFHAERLAIALELARAGYVLAPVRIHRDPITGKKAPDYLWEGLGWHDRASGDPAQILDWWAQYGPGVSFLVDTGRSGAIGIDLDVIAERTDPDTGEVFPAVDAVAEWGLSGWPVGSMLVNTPSGGQHQYWRADDADQVLNAKRVLGLPIDVRGHGGHLFAPGAVVLGPDGEPEPNGLYVLSGPLVPAAELAALPAELRTKLAVPARERRAPAAQGELKDRRWVIEQCQEQLERIRSWPAREGTGFRSALLGAAMVLGRAVAGGIVTRTYAVTKLGDAVYAVWGVVDPDDDRWIRDGLDDGAEDPWTIVRVRPEPVLDGEIVRAHGPASSQVGRDASELSRSTPDLAVTQGHQNGEIRTGSGGTPAQTEAISDGELDPLAITPEELAARVRARKLAEEIERLEIRAEATAEISRRRRAGRASIASGVIDDLDAIPAPAMLLGSLIPEDAVGILSGRSGSYKSFLATSWAAAIGTGRAWLDRDEFAVSKARTVLYVAAEGPRGAAGRLRAWETATGTSRAGKVLLYPRPIVLNDPDQAQELAEYVGDNGIGFVVVDTLRMSTPGAEENSSTDWSAVFGAMTRLRDDHGCGGLLVDHSGHQDDWRPRGTSAKVTDPDYLLSVAYDGAGAGPEAQRELTVRKLKDDEVTGSWPIILRPVNGQRFPLVDIGRVGDLGRFVPAGRWWEPDATTMPESVRELIATGPGSAAARDIWRVLRWVDSPDGLSQADIRRNLKEQPATDGRVHGSTSIDRAFVLLAAQQIVSKHPTNGRYTLTLRGRNGT